MPLPPGSLNGRSSVNAPVLGLYEMMLYVPPTAQRNCRCVMSEYEATEAFSAAMAVASKVPVDAPWTMLTLPCETKFGDTQENSMTLNDQIVDSRTCLQARLMSVRVNSNGSLGMAPRNSVRMSASAMCCHVSSLQVT